jgi:hypothetical protein
MCVITSTSSACVTPLSMARLTWPRNCSVRFIAISAAQVMRLRSRLLRPGLSQTSPYTTFSVRSISLGANDLTCSRAVTVGFDMHSLLFIAGRRR